VYAALKEFGMPLKNLTPDDLAQKGYFYQMGRPPLRIDIMMSIPWPKRTGNSGSIVAIGCQ
jgi:hypothetical protein